MKFYLTSDLHMGSRRRGDRANIALAQYVMANPTDALILVGDLGKSPEHVHQCLALFEGFPGVKMAVPGNHDIWLQGYHSDNSWELHEEILPALFEAHGFHALHMAPLMLGQVGFVGSMGWYDYSFRDEIGVALKHYRSKTPPWSSWPLWNDATHAKFPFNDESLTHKLAQRLERHLHSLEQAQNVVAAIHHVVSKALLIHPRERVPKTWRFANAFLGAECFGDILRRDPRVHQIFCGHIHMMRRAILDRAACTCIASDYKKKELLLATPDRVLEARIFDRPQPKRSRA